MIREQELAKESWQCILGLNGRQSEIQKADHMPEIVFSPHSLYEMKRRGLTREMVRTVVEEARTKLASPGRENGLSVSFRTGKIREGLLGPCLCGHLAKTA